MTITNGATILLLAITIAEGGYKAKLKSLRSNLPLLLMIVFYLLHLISYIHSADKADALFGLEKKLSLFLLPIIFAGYSPPAPERSRAVVLKYFVYSTLAACVYCLGYAFYRNYTIGDPAALPYSFAENFGVQNTWGLYWDFFSYSELGSPLRLHPTYFSMFTVFSVIILLNRFLEGREWKSIQKTAMVLAGFFLLAFTFLLSSRIALLGLLLSLLAFFIMYAMEHGLRAKQLLTSLGVVAVLALLLFALPVTRYRIITETANLFRNQMTPELDSGVSQRTLVWRTASQLAKKNLLLGKGLGDVEHALNASYEKQGHPELKSLNAHNQYLQTALATGLPGVILLLALFLYTFYLAVVNRDRISLSFLIIVMAACLTEAILETNKGIVFFGFFYCHLFFSYRQQSAPG